jgi:lipid II:glycine glycyltransferase (peptidoglycan interpeptide bridge formation enzyme)
MILETLPESLSELDNTGIFQQTSFWGKLKNEHGAKSRAFNIKIDGKILAKQKNQPVKEDLLVILQAVNSDTTIAYIPYGPKTEPREDMQGPLLEEISEALRSYLPGNCINIRYDLPWESLWARDDNYYSERNTWLGPPEKKTQEFRINFNTVKWNLHKANSDILPSNTLFLDLRKDLKDVLLSMKPKTRYNIRLAERRGVRVRKTGIDRIDIWYELYRETTARNRIFLHDIEYFRTVLEINEKQNDTSPRISMLVAEKDGIPLAALFLATSLKRATYLYGASSSLHRNLMGTYALQWEAIKTAKKEGCTEYDMFGVAPGPDPSHPMYGLYRFKTGFGGNLFHRMGCWDFPLDEEKYMLFEMAELNSQGYHLS